MGRGKTLDVADRILGQVCSFVSLHVKVRIEKIGRLFAGKSDGPIYTIGLRSVASCFCVIISAYSTDLFSCEAELTLNCPPSGDIQSYIDDLFIQVNGGVSSPPPCEPVADIRWDWGDGVVSDSLFPAGHGYSEYGDYSITADALDISDNLIASSSCEVSVSQELTTGQVDFDATDLHDRVELTVTLSDGSNLVLLRTEVVEDRAGSYSWIGVVEGEDESFVILSVVDSAIVGSIQTAYRLWSVALDDQITLPVLERDPYAFPPDDGISEDDVIFKSGFENAPGVQQALGRMQAENIATECLDYKQSDPYWIDVLVLYSAELGSFLPEATVQYSMMLANYSLMNSKIPVWLNLVHSEQVEFTDNSSVLMEDTLNSLTKGTGAMSDVHYLRDEYAADLVVLMVEHVGKEENSGFDENKNVAGIAGSLDPEEAFAVVRRDAIDNHTFTHEIGHLFGAEHDRYAVYLEGLKNGPSLPPEELPGAIYGWVHIPPIDPCDTQEPVDSCLPFSTLMAYQFECKKEPKPYPSFPGKCRRVALFSDWNNAYMGSPVGDPLSQNVLAFKEWAKGVACNRQNPRIVDIDFSENEPLGNCVNTIAANEGWERALDVTHLDCFGMGIESLKGVEYFLQLKVLSLNNNKVADLSPLSGLTKQLKVLSLNENNISDVSPLENLVNLTSLSLNSNKVADLSPLSGLTKLMYLWVGIDEKVKDLTPLKDLILLEGLSLVGGGITSLEGLQYATNLKQIDFTKNSISDLSPISEIEQLGSLALSFNSISDLSHLESLIRLEVLLLDNNEVSNVAALKTLTNLRTLALHSNTISDIGALSSLSSLEVLDVSGNPITDISPISPLQKIRVFSCAFCNVADISALQQHKVLTDLLIPDNNISDLSPLEGNETLLRLNLTNNAVTTVASLVGLKQLIWLWMTRQKWPPGLDCGQQTIIVDALPSTDVLIDGFWDDPNDDPDEGNIVCFP